MYENGQNGTWTDPGTKLMWQVQAQNNNGQWVTWQRAKDYCANLELGGYTDWRLPTISELRSLIRDCDKTVTGGTCGVTDECLEERCLKSDMVSCLGCKQIKGPANGCYWPGNMQADMHRISNTNPDSTQTITTTQANSESLPFFLLCLGLL